MRFSVEDAIAAGLWVALGILALLSASDDWSTRTFLVTSEEVNHAHEVVEQLDHLLAEMTDAETGQRGYLITGSVRYLAPYEQATTRIADTLHAIRVLTSDGSAQGERLNRLVPQVASRLAIMRETMDLYDREGLAAARQHVLTDRGKTVMDDIRKLVGEMDRAERMVLLDRGAYAHASARLTRVVVLVSDLLALGLVGSSYVIALRAGGRGDRRAAPAGGARRPRRRGRVSQPTSGDDRDRPHPTPPDPPEPRRQRDQVHAQGERAPRGRSGGGHPSLLRGHRHRHRPRRGAAGAALHRLLAGGRLDHAPLRGHGSRARDLEAARRHAGRRPAGAKPPGRGQHVHPDHRRRLARGRPPARPPARGPRRGGEAGAVGRRASGAPRAHPPRRGRARRAPAARAPSPLRRRRGRDGRDPAGSLRARGARHRGR